MSVEDKAEAVYCGNGKGDRDLYGYSSLDSPSGWHVSKSDKLTSTELQDTEAFTGEF